MARKPTYEELEQSIEELGRAASEAFHFIPFPLLISSLETGRCLEANEAFLRVFGYSCEEITGRTTEELKLWVRPSDFCEALEALKEGARVRLPKAEVRTKSGEIRIVTLGAGKIELRGEACVVTAINDITEHKRMEEALLQSEEKLHVVLSSMDDLVFVLDRSDRFVSVYAPKGRLYLKPDEFLGQKHSDVMPAEVDKLFGRALAKVKKGGIADYEYQLEVPDGTRWFNMKLSPISGNGGNAGSVGVARDITERKRVEQEKDRLEMQLMRAQKMEAIGTLAGGIAHDFNNVLYSIIGYTELAIEDMPEGSLPRSNLQEVLKGALRARDMVKQILAFSREAETEKKPIKLQSIVREAVELLRTMPKTIEIRQHVDEDCGSVMADSTQMHQVIVNLATNAYQAMREKGGVLELSLTEEETRPGTPHLDLSPGRYLKLSVRDTGHGIDGAILEKIFNPYFSTKGPGGTGMGLAVTHGIVTSNGGAIDVHSKLGQGATFNVYLPLIETTTVESSTVSAGPVPTGTEHVLFVDDEEYLVYMTQQILERLGYQVTTRTSSLEALAAFRADPNMYDLVITDMTMPHMTGVELAPKLRDVRPDIPIIICTGFSEMIDEDRAREIGILGYVMKPILKDDIARTIRRALEEAHGKARTA